MGQLSSAQNTTPAGEVPCDTEANPKAPINAVSLRNRRKLEEVPSKKRKKIENPLEEVVAKQPQSIIAKLPHPFPQRLQKLKDNASYKKFLDISKQMQINIPLVDIFQEVPKYAKDIKEIVANKRKLTEFETVALTKECISIIHNMLPPKLKDPGFGDPRLTSVGLQLADRSLAIPDVVIEDMLVQVGIFIFPANFVILDYVPN
uniref:Uncharacterized protein n=1 Tax=Nicotiana tabacum TaxID=4097 RepID=A0A1S4DB02_TOBAC|nr:PREDICTED: uncharacterized protein LOC107827840 [Nicotiana tabacum]